MREAWRKWRRATVEFLEDLAVGFVFAVLALLGEEQEPGAGDVRKWFEGRSQ